VFRALIIFFTLFGVSLPDCFAQQYYIVNAKTGKSIKLSNSNIYLEVEFTPKDTSIKKIHRHIGCEIDSCNESVIYIYKHHEEIETYYTDGTEKKSTDLYYKNHQHASIIFDSINVNEIVEVNKNGDITRSKFIDIAAPSAIIGLGIIVVVGPFLFKENYFSAIGISTISTIPFLVSMAIFDNRFKLKHKESAKKKYWFLEYRKE
jgi:hypothetical protein